MIADAPIEATIIGYPGQGESIFVIRAMKKIEQKQANIESNLALMLKLTGSIEKDLKKRNGIIVNNQENNYKHNLPDFVKTRKAQ